MTPEEIQERIEELDRAILKEGAEVVIFYEEESQDCEVIGNRAGYLRLGVEMLKAAIAPLRTGEMFTPVSVDYLLTSPRGLGVKRFTRLDDVQSALPPLPESTWKTKAAGTGCLLLGIFMVVCMLVGFGQVFTWLFR
jgi:hypothetical protein